MPKDQTTHAEMASVGIDIGLVIPDGTEGAPKRDRARQALGEVNREQIENTRNLTVARFEDNSRITEDAAIKAATGAYRKLAYEVSEEVVNEGRG